MIRYAGCWIALLLMLSSVRIAAQDDRQSRTVPPAPKAFVTTIVVRDIIRDYNIGFAKRIGWHHTAEVRLGWVHPNRIVSKYHEQYLLSTDWKFKGGSIYLQLNKWRFRTLLKKERQTFRGIYVGYRYMYFLDQQMPLGGPDHNEMDEVLTLSQWRNDFLVFATVGLRISKYSTSEISLGACVSWTHSNVSATKFYPFPEGTPQYESYRQEMTDKIRRTDGISIVPVLRVSSRIGYFRWE